MQKKDSKKNRNLSANQINLIRKNYPKSSAEELAKSIDVPAEVVQEYIDQLHPPLSTGKKFFFWLVLFMSPLVFLLLLETSLRITNYGGDLNSFVPADFDDSYMMISRGVGARYFPAKAVNPAASYNVFLKEKPANAYRIFVLGGSSAAGYPYLFNGAFSQMLKTRLEDFFPENKIEMVNVAMPAVNSFTLLDLAEDIIEWQPDAFLIYAGHNEFYGALGVGSTESIGYSRTIIKFYLKIQGYRCMVLVRDLIHLLSERFASSNNEPLGSDRTLMERMVKDQEIAYRGKKYQQALSNYTANLKEIIEIARKHGVEILISDLVSNFRGQKPFISLFAEDTDIENWNSHFQEGIRLQQSAQYSAALKRFRQAAEIDSMPAKLNYHSALCLESLGKHALARKAFYKAKELDGLRFRASEDFNNAIYMLSKETNAPVVYLKSVFEEESVNGLIGSNLMLEHLHPNLKGYFLMAKAFCEAMRKNGFIAENWDLSRSKPDSIYWQTTGVTPIDHEVAGMRVRILTAGWPFQPKGKPNPSQTVDPKNYFEKIALDYWKKDITWEKAHVLMAQYYMDQGELENAEMEYKALIQYMPINISPYLFLANLYLQQEKFAELRSILLPTLNLEPTAFAHKWIGILNLKDGEAERSISHLKNALELDSDDLQTMYNLCGAYALSGKMDNAKKLTQKLIRLAPNYPGIQDLWRQLQ